LRATQLYDYYSKIDHIMKSHFQRMIRRAWLAYKIKKAAEPIKIDSAKRRRSKNFRANTLQMPIVTKITRRHSA